MIPQTIYLTRMVMGEFSNVLFLCGLALTSGQEERLIFPHFIPDYSHFLQNKLIKAHQNKLINHGMRMIGTLKNRVIFVAQTTNLLNRFVKSLRKSSVKQKKIIILDSVIIVLFPFSLKNTFNK